ncbi:Ig-like domain-containing protein [Protaetiibacter intestinalis]|uniref:Ig-like domain-containing protein n=1 Tax=Protaetiibacter intestinalis TaxID=2419774 RepID=UPI0013003DDF|nr:hypothetical protein [Protaetiibacter intestinalis]
MPAPRLLRHPGVPVVAGLAVVGVVAGFAIAAPGYDSREVPHVETSVWVTRAAGEYARLDTELGELDTIRKVDDPSGLVQSGPAGLVFGQGNRQYWSIDPASPADLVVDEGGASGNDPVARAQPTPSGTTAVLAGGSQLLALTGGGPAYLSELADPGAAVAFRVLDPYADLQLEEGETRPVYAADAGAIDEAGDVVLYSAEEGAVRRWDGRSGAFAGDAATVPEAPADDDGLAMALVGGRWVLFAPDSGQLWVQGRDAPITVDVDGSALLQASSGTGSTVFVADDQGLVAVDLDSGAADRRVEASGVPAAPAELDGVVYAAWLSTDTGTLWSSDTGESIRLETEADALDAVVTLQPVLRGNGDRMVLNETSSGLVWLVPSGELIPTVAWADDEVSDVSEGEVTVDDASEQLPPTAEPDSFGVRAGALVALPVLFNDHDPNRSDVLSISADSLAAGLADPSFGDLVLTSGGQALAIRVRATAGSTTFGYAVTDGLAVSPPTTVTLTVVADDAQSAPVWCGVAHCTQDWPTPQLAAGGTITVPVLDGWVDPEGDPFVLSDVRVADPTAPVSAMPTADGRLAIRHTDPNAGAQLVTVTVVVMDARGATAEKDLELSVSSAPTLSMRPGAYIARVGSRTVVDVVSLVSGGSGSYRLLDAADSSTRAGGLALEANTADGTVSVEASAEGEYAVSVTVQDTGTLAERSAVLRFTAIPGALPLAVPPLTAFVRAGEDATVGVLDAVQNTSGRVLIVATAESDTPELTAGVVGQSYVRVRGSTQDGQPGPIGTIRYQVTDGAGAFAEGTLTVFLVAPAHDVAPIAVDDAVTVRAGALIDVPVLANDIGPRGERLALYPDVTGSGTPGELVFAAGSTVRYLAPDEPGVYTVSYSSYLESSPGTLATARLDVTVLAEGQNKAPEPRLLVARVLAGGTVDIPVDRYGIDPDGDVVTLVDVAQPGGGQGVATVAASGASIVYRAPAAGVRDGQVEFGYTVRDSEGQTATGTVQVGVLDEDVADVTPVTFSEHLRVRVGSTTPLTVLPLLNDRDPAQGALSLVDLVPNAPTTGDGIEYARLEGLIGSDTSLEDGVVSLLAGDVVGTHSYIYTVQSSATSSTAQGLIVVTVSEGAPPDRPVVADTVVDLTTRNQLARGIDVVSGKVTWATGDPSGLTLSLWDEDDEYTVNGWSISGRAPAGGDLVPFRLDGTDPEGQPVVAYGFLRIPAFDDMRVELAPGVDPVQVDEEDERSFDVPTALRIDPADQIELREGDFPVQRPGSSCTRVDATHASYRAGRDAPWTDTCAVYVRVAGQSAWSVVAVPILIAPGDPQPLLNSITRTIAPGESESIDLYENLTTWEGGRVGDAAALQYKVTSGGSAFVLTQSGRNVTIEARADAPPGTRVAFVVSLVGQDVLTATITAVVGIAAPDSPKGAVLSTQCSVTGGACTTKVIGVPGAGEYDPFAGSTGAGLTLTGVSAPDCAVASFTASGDQITANWPPGPKPLGGSCTAVFTVKDAQGRPGTGELTLDLQGYPATPQTVTTVAYTATSVTVEVALGDAASAHPALTAVALYEGNAKVATVCTPAGPAAYRCTMNGLQNGQPHGYSARAVNTVGESAGTTVHTTWAYAAPKIDQLTAEPVYDGEKTSATEGVVQLKIKAGDDALSFRIDNTHTTVPRSGATTTATITLPAGAPVSVTVIPVSKFEPPTGSGGEGSSKSVTVTPAGLPIYPSGPAVTITSSTTATVTIADPDANGSSRPREQRFFATTGDGGCSLDSHGHVTGPNGGDDRSNDDGHFTGLKKFTDYHFFVCATFGFGVMRSDVVDKISYVPPPAPTGTLSYTVDGSPALGGYMAWDSLDTAPVIAPAPTDFTIVYYRDGTPGPSFQIDKSKYSTYAVAYCLQTDPTQCGPQAAITPAKFGAPFDITFYSGLCPTTTPVPTVSSSATGQIVVYTTLVLFDPLTFKYTWSFQVAAYGTFSSIDGLIVTCTS